ncbi:microtubule-associated protein TORTIFOLIA1-like isoform X1 [Gossypium australe]|uniref:Microtubule-associated protein TORTIFOLIA1-like isoform X1 n=1 Tax=Gossypium australe TaxID=47621 RepID=A0A5B6U769_9ROSI|nr:microtubule-associated protein TORTIFOLIA1-like isoform X1 [Gossypium australe]
MCVRPHRNLSPEILRSCTPGNLFCHNCIEDLFNSRAISRTSLKASRQMSRMIKHNESSCRDAKGFGRLHETVVSNCNIRAKGLQIWCLPCLHY